MSSAPPVQKCVGIFDQDGRNCLRTAATAIEIHATDTFGDLYGRLVAETTLAASATVQCALLKETRKAADAAAICTHNMKANVHDLLALVRASEECDPAVITYVVTRASNTSNAGPEPGVEAVPLAQDTRPHHTLKVTNSTAHQEETDGTSDVHVAAATASPTQVAATRAWAAAGRAAAHPLAVRSSSVPLAVQAEGGVPAAMSGQVPADTVATRCAPCLLALL